MIDESAHKVFDYGMKDWHDFRTHKCSHCSRQLDIYYCESRLYLVRCKHCKIVSLVEAGNPNEAAEKVSRRAAPENKPLTLEQLRKMKGQPVYCIGQTRFDVHFDGWKVVTKNNSMVNVIRFTDGTDFPVDVYGKRLLAYARRPEGSETNG